MVRFECDYLEGAPLPVLEAIAKANLEQNPGYGFDPHSDHARDLIRQACQAPEAGVYFLVGGTQANLTVIASCLKNYQGVIAPQTSHIFNHETGAIEATGHKILSVETADGKLTAQQVRDVCQAYWKETHALFFVQPGMVYISQTTEVGTMYSRAEIAAIHDVCKEYGMKLFVDGARLGYALAAPDSDMTLADLPQICDVFTVGGTKQGALFGEAVVIMDEDLSKEFPYHIKQRGGLLARQRSFRDCGGGLPGLVVFQRGKQRLRGEVRDKRLQHPGGGGKDGGGDSLCDLHLKSSFVYRARSFGKHDFIESPQGCHMFFQKVDFSPSILFLLLPVSCRSY